MVEKYFVQQDIKQDQILTGTKLDFPVISQFLSSADDLWSSRIFVALPGLWLRRSDQRTADVQTSSRYSHRNGPEQSLQNSGLVEAQSAAAALFPFLHSGKQSMKQFKCFAHNLDKSMGIVWWITPKNRRWKSDTGLELWFKRMKQYLSQVINPQWQEKASKSPEKLH